MPRPSTKMGGHLFSPAPLAGLAPAQQERLKCVPFLIVYIYVYGQITLLPNHHHTLHPQHSQVHPPPAPRPPGGLHADGQGHRGGGHAVRLRPGPRAHAPGVPPLVRCVCMCFGTSLCVYVCIYGGMRLALLVEAHTLNPPTLKYTHTGLPMVHLQDSNAASASTAAALAVAGKQNNNAIAAAEVIKDPLSASLNNSNNPVALDGDNFAMKVGLYHVHSLYPSTRMQTHTTTTKHPAA